jgi:hypothetical protein
MQGMRFKAAAMAAVIALLLVPAGVLAKPIVPPGFTVKASNGYSIFAIATPESAGEPGRLGLFVIGKRDGAIYFAPATVTEKSIQADLGELGQISVVFHASGEVRTERSECGGKPISFDSGYYEGTIAFHGEQEYTEVDTTAGRGNLGFLLSLVCPGISGGRSAFYAGAELDLRTAGHRPGPRLMVIKNRPDARTRLEASCSERHDGISILRFTSMVAPVSAFEYDPRIRTATVRPPAPFSGVGRFHRSAEPANRWTGNLTVDLPGRRDVKLAGGGFRASLAHAHWDWSGS